VQREGLGQEPGLAGVGQHLPGQAGRLVAGMQDVPQRSQVGGTGSEYVQGQLRVSQNDCQQIVEVVRHAARQDGQTLQLLHPPQAFIQGPPFTLGTLPLGHV
jgi:hypothetical protein